MKSKKFTLILLIILGVFSFQSFAQVLDVPPLTDGQPTALNSFILADTTASGERNDPDRIYKLQRGAIYLFNEAIEMDFSLRLTADDDDPDSPVRPPMVAASPHPVSGELPGSWFLFVGDGIEANMKNILFQNVSAAEEYVAAWLFQYTGDNLDIVYDNCVFNGFEGGVHLIGKTGATHVSFVSKDCIYRNIAAKMHPFLGQSTKNQAARYQKLHIINNTFFNANSYILSVRYIVDDLRFEHNTIFGNTIQPMLAFFGVNETIKDNIYFAPHSLGVTAAGARGGWFLDEVPAIISVWDGVEDMEGDYTNANRVIDVSNNAYFVPQRIKDFWDASDSVIAEPQWINPTTQTKFDDASTYPHLDIKDNYIDVDPGFVDTQAIDTIIDQRIRFNEGFNEFGWEWLGEDFHYAPNGNLFNIPWPLPEDLSYTNETLLTGSTTGGPLGDSRWFPDVTGINSPDASANGFNLSQNYPNPFSTVTEFSFKILNSGRTRLDVYNIHGQNVAALVDRVYSPGTYNIQFDAGALPSGIYFYKLQSNGSSATKRMIIQK